MDESFRSITTRELLVSNVTTNVNSLSIMSNVGINVGGLGTGSGNQGRLSLSNAAGTFNCYLLGSSTSMIPELIVGTYEAQASAVLKLSSTSQGFLPPRMTSVQRAAIAAPATGLVVYDTDLNQICVWVGAKWQKVTQTDV
jgi:hypothetical protein